MEVRNKSSCTALTAHCYVVLCAHVGHVRVTGGRHKLRQDCTNTQKSAYALCERRLIQQYNESPDSYH